jgi:hypothetical protein
MTLQELINRVRTYTRDFTGSIYREVDIDIFLRESFDRFSIIPEFSTLTYPATKPTVVELIPERYQYLLSIYASSRCLFQDEQDYRAGTLMNEFETKLEELKSLIESGDIIIKGTDGNTITISQPNDYVVDIYFDKGVDDNDYFNGGD